MLAILIVTDKGQTYAMGRTLESTTQCIESLRGKPVNVSYVADKEKRLRYLSKAYEIVEGLSE